MYCSFVRAYTSQRVRETQAGTTFLEILQRNNDVIELPTRTFGASNVSNDFVDIKTKRNSLRIALEHLIIEYLRELNNEEIYSTRRRRSVKDVLKTDNNEFVLDEKTKEFGAANTNFYTSFPESDNINADCKNKYTRVAQLDQSELDNTFVNDSDNIHNIRRILMYR